VWALNPYAHQVAIKQGLKLMSRDTAVILHRIEKLGLLPEYVENYIDLTAVKAIALLSQT
jgi:hypothetical protein